MSQVVSNKLLCYNVKSVSRRDNQLTIRNFRWEDVPALAELENRLLRMPHASIAPKTRFVTEFLGQPNLSPEKDLFLYESHGALRGYGLIFPELSISRSVLMMKAHPDSDASVVEEALLDAALRRAGGLEADVLQVQTRPDSRPESACWSGGVSGTCGPTGAWVGRFRTCPKWKLRRVVSSAATDRMATRRL